MNPYPGPACPACSSFNTAEFEDESRHRSRDTFPLILLSALLILGLYFALIVYSYLYYPLTIIIFAIAAAIFFNRREKKQKKAVPRTRQFICLDCEHEFTSLQ